MADSGELVGAYPCSVVMVGQGYLPKVEERMILIGVVLTSTQERVNLAVTRAEAALLREGLGEAIARGEEDNFWEGN